MVDCVTNKDFTNQELIKNSLYYSVSLRIESLLKKLDNNLITLKELLENISEMDIDILQFPSIDYNESLTILSAGTSIVQGIAQGKIRFSLEKADKFNEPTIFITNHLTNSDLCFFPFISGAIAQNEDPTTHGVIVARSMSIPVINQVQDFQWISDQEVRIGKNIFREGDLITLDGFSGNIIKNNAGIFYPKDSSILNKLVTLLESESKIVIHGSADTPAESIKALNKGGLGIEPRSEHMFFGEQELNLFRCLIFSNGLEKDAEIINSLEKVFENALIQIFENCKEKPVVVRLFDPPLHEFLPRNSNEINNISKILNVTQEYITEKIQDIREINPMMGLRGARLLIKRSNLTSMQARAILNAAYKANYKNPWISIPMVVDKNEIIFIKKILEKEKLEKLYRTNLQYSLGVMIETPRVVFKANEIAEHVSFMSFGTNDLTAQTFCFSRGDVLKKFLSHYLEEKILMFDPFFQLDDVVKLLLEKTVNLVRSVNNKIHIGLCGEQGTCKDTVFFCNQIAINSISCNPNKINHVKLYAAQAALQNNK